MTEPTQTDRKRAEDLLTALSKPMFVWRMANGKLRTGQQHDTAYSNALDEVHRLLQEYVTDVTGLPPKNVISHEFICDSFKKGLTNSNSKFYTCARRIWIVVRPGDPETVVLGRLVLSGWSLREDGRVLCPSCDSKEK
jgi:hypothetical protein